MTAAIKGVRAWVRSTRRKLRRLGLSETAYRRRLRALAIAR